MATMATWPRSSAPPLLSSATDCRATRNARLPPAGRGGPRRGSWCGWVPRGVDECYGYHNWPSFKLGRMHIKAGPLMAHPSTFTIVVTARRAWFPASARSRLTASHLVVALQSIVSRNVASSEQAVVTVTMIHGGEVFNVIPDQVRTESGSALISILTLTEPPNCGLDAGDAQGDDP